VITLEESDAEEDGEDPSVFANNDLQSNEAFIRRQNRFILTLFILYLLSNPSGLLVSLYL